MKPWILLQCIPTPCGPHAAIGHLVRQALENVGFEVEWDGTSDKKLEITGFNG